MHRQSLGSPSSKLHHGGIILPKDDAQQHQPSSSASPSNDAFSPVYARGGGLVVEEEKEEEEEEEEEEKVKKLKLKPKSTLAEIYIHFIPMLTLLCFLVLYLSSHSPSQIDLAGFNGYKHLPDSGDSRGGTQTFREIVEIKQGNTLAVSWKHRRFLRRKMADF